MNTPGDSRPNRALENAATFGGLFVASQIGEAIGDRIHDPNIVDVPHGQVIIMGLVLSGVATAVIDRIRSR